MPYDIRQDSDLLVLRFRGAIDSEDLRRSIEEVEAIEAKEDRTPDRITDLSSCEADKWSAEVVEELAMRRRRAQLRNMVKSAIYAPDDLQFGYSRMFEMLNDNPRIEVRVFRDFSAAVLWLREAVKG